MNFTTQSEGAWIEAISLFEETRHGDYVAGLELLGSTQNQEVVLYNFLRLLSALFHSEDPDKLEAFAEAAYRMSPPPIPRGF